MRVAAIAATTFALAGCSFFVPPTPPAPTSTGVVPPVTDGPTGSGLTPSSSAPTPATPATSGATPSPADTNIATLQGGSGASKVLVLPDSAAPAGYQAVPARDTGSYRMSVCGVDLEPSVPVDGAQKRWQSGNDYLEEHVRTYSDKTAQNVLVALRSALPTCTTYTNGSSTYTVEKLAMPKAATDTVGWRQRLTLPAQPAPTSTASPTAAPTPQTPHVLIQDVAVTAKGTSIVLLASYAVDVAPQPQVLTTPLQKLYALGR